MSKTLLSILSFLKEPVILLYKKEVDYSSIDPRKHWKGLKPLLRNKYFLTLAAFIIWVGLFDENNLIERHQLNKEIRTIHKEKEYYLARIAEDAARLQELQTNTDNLEKFAREQYLMHGEDEDVFIIVKQ
jgi:cell division protein DivIC